MTDGESVIELELIISRYLRNAAAAEKAGRKLDSTLEDVADSATEAASDLNKVGAKGIKINIKVEDSALRTAAGDVADLNAAAPDIRITLSGEKALTDARENVAAINSLDPAVDISLTGDQAVRDAEQNLRDIDALNPSVDLDVNGVPDILEVRDYLLNINRLAKVNFIITGLGIAKNAISAIAGLPIVSTIGELNQAVREYETAGGALTDTTRELINNEFTRGLAETPTQVALIAAQLDKAGQGGDTLSTSLQSVFDFATAAKKPVEDVTKIALQMVQAGSADSIAAAIDVMAVGFTTGADRAGDMLGALEEFTPALTGLGLTAAQQIELFNQSIEGGARNASVIGEIFQDLKGNLTTAVEAGAGNAQFDALDSLGLIDSGLAEQVAKGEASGAELGAAVMTGIETAIANGEPIDPDALILAIFGQPVNMVGMDVFKGIDWTEVIGAQIDPAAAETAVAPLRNTLVSAAQELGRVLEFEVADKFRIAGLPLQKLLEDAPAKMRELAELIRSGQGIPEALEIVLEAPGLADTIHDFESGFVNAIISFLDGLAQIIALIPGANPAPLRGTVASLAEGQLPFDLINADNAAEIRSVVQTAFDRGVSESSVYDSLLLATQQLTDSDKLVAAETLLNRFLEIAPLILTESTGQFGNDPTGMFESREDILRRATPEQLSEFQSLTGGALIPSGLPSAVDAVSEIRTEITDAKEALTDMGDAAAGANPMFVNMNDALNEGKTYTDNFKTSTDALGLGVRNTGDDLGAFESDIDLATLAIVPLNAATEAGAASVDEWSQAWIDNAPDVVEATSTVTDAITALNEQMLINLGLTGGGGAGSGQGGHERARGGRTVPGSPYMVGEMGRELVSFSPGAYVLNNASTEAILSGLAAFMAGGGSGGGGNVYNVNIVTNINAQGDAGAVMAGNRTAQQMRGYLNR